ncbi:MAG TPA: DUF2177 family protein [Clostridia bacterium]|nr:DUF2177 family protein [Clostridia bacterium]
MIYIKNFMITFIVFMTIDLIWLGVVAKKLYNKYLGYIMAKNINWLAAVIFYIIFVIGMLIFVIQPALAKDSMQHIILYGMAYGFITYATYDLTNLATLKDWPIEITIIDLIWGTSLSTLTSYFSYLIINRF